MSRRHSTPGDHDTLVDESLERSPMLHNPHLSDDVELQTLVPRLEPNRGHPRFEEMLGRARTLGRKQRESWNRFNGAGRKRIGVVESLQNIAVSSFLNVLFLVIPFAWMAHFLQWSNRLKFVLCFISMIPLEKMFEWGGEQLALYCGKDMGDLVIITMNNTVEAVLTIILLARCELRLVQSTVVGVVLLHLLLVPGTAFLTGGSVIWEQKLNPYTTQLNQSLLIMGVMTLVLPCAYFGALDRGFTAVSQGSQVLLNDKIRAEFLQMSRATAFFLFNVYLLSRIFLHYPPGGIKTSASHPDAPEALKYEEHLLKVEEHKVHSWICVVLLGVTVALTAVTAQFLVSSVEPLRAQGHIGDEFFGVILLPIISFGADATVAIGYFARRLLKEFFGISAPSRPSELAKARSIDLSIQFTLFWFPLFIMIAWWTSKPLVALFDMYEIAVLVAASFMVNYITQDAKTNWAEGASMVTFYILIALWTWFYPGQEELKVMLSCNTSVQDAINRVLNTTTPAG